MPFRNLTAAARRTLLAGGGALLLTLLCALGANADSLEKLALRIAAGSTPVTLAEFVRQTGLQVLFDFDAIKDTTTRQVDGNLDAREALALMFEGSELTFEFINPRTIAVRRQPPEPTKVAQPGNGT